MLGNHRLFLVSLSLIALSLLSPKAKADSAGASIDFQSFPGLDWGSREVLGNSLRIAAREGRGQLIEKLISMGADPNAQGVYGETALLNAANYNQSAVAQLLLEKGAVNRLRDSKDDTPLIQAAKNSAYRVIAAILSSRSFESSEVNDADHDGRTALISAAKEGSLKSVELLLKVKGIDVSHADDSGKTALDYVVEESTVEVGGPYTEVFRAIHRAGGKTVFFSLPKVEATAQPPQKIP
jgi:ankyrin repeat protein